MPPQSRPRRSSPSWTQRSDSKPTSQHRGFPPGWAAEGTLSGLAEIGQEVEHASVARPDVVHREPLDIRADRLGRLGDHAGWSITAVGQTLSIAKMVTFGL